MMASSSMLSFAARSQLSRSIRRFSDAAVKPVRKPVSMEERAANRAARKERASRLIAQARGTPVQDASGATAVPAAGRSVVATRWMWRLGVAVPAGLLIWGYNDENSPPAKLSDAIGLTDWISSYTNQFAQPAHDKLLPDWSEVSFRMRVLLRSRHDY